MKQARIALLDDTTNATIWTGGLREFFKANAIEAEERAFICALLRDGAGVQRGGGAAPVVHIVAA